MTDMTVDPHHTAGHDGIQDGLKPNTQSPFKLVKIH